VSVVSIKMLKKGTYRYACVYKNKEIHIRISLLAY
jgi:hypothetical protein